MTCNDLLDRMTDIVDGSVDPALHAEIDAHLASCARCRALVADLQRLTQAAASLNRASPPAGTWARIAARLEADPELRRASGMAQTAGRGGLVPANWAWTPTQKKRLTEMIEPGQKPPALRAPVGVRS